MAETVIVDASCGHTDIVLPLTHAAVVTVNVWNVHTDVHIIVDDLATEIDATGYFVYQFNFDCTECCYLVVATSPGVEEYMVVRTCLLMSDILNRTGLLMGMSC